MQTVDDLLLRSTEIVRQRGADAFLQELRLAIVRWLGPNHLEDDATAEEFFRASWNPPEQRALAACFLRLFHDAPAIFDSDHQLRVFAISLLDMFPQVYKRLNITHDQQTYRKQAALGGALSIAKESLSQRVATLSTLAGFDESRRRFMRTLRDDLVVAVYGPFFPDAASIENADAAFKSVQAYLDAADSERVSAFREARHTIEEWTHVLKRGRTSVSEQFFERGAHRLLDALENDYNAGPFSKPGRLTVRPVDKRYPLAACGVEFEFGFDVESAGAGPALDVQITLASTSRVYLIDGVRSLGDLSPGSRLSPVEFAAKVLDADATPLSMEVSASWTNADGTVDNVSWAYEVESQAADIPWNELGFQNPYSLQPVENDDELIGRSDLLARIESKLRSKNVGSFWIYGQKRVGKTSIVRTLQKRLSKGDSSFIAIYLEAGEFIRPSAEDTVDSLATRLCEEIQAADDRFSDLSIPEFRGALSPLDGFLRAAQKRVPDVRIVFILDEFDELPVELYRLGEIGNAFFVSLRSISGKAPYGFILVGGEKMEHIVNIQGDHLNRFEPLAVDYFHRISHLSDFEELVRKPVAPWCTITDLAVAEVLEASAGNPFFAKWICNTMYEDVVRRSDAYVTEREMRRAVSTAASRAGSNQFQHFWKDGIFEISNERIEERTMVRRQVLLAFADALRHDGVAGPDAIVSRAIEYGITDVAVRTELNDFERRDILRRADSRYNCTVRLFEKWLVDRGVKEIVTSFADEMAILQKKRREEDLRVSSGEIVRLTDGWGVFKGARIGEEKVRAWLAQFGDYSDQRLMFELLQGLRFYSSSSVRSKLREIHSSVKAELVRRGAVRRQSERALKTTDNVIVTTLDGAGKSGPQMQRLYIQENNLYSGRAIDSLQIGRALIELDDLMGIVIIDDFVGTGTQAADGLADLISQHGGLIRERGIVIFFTWVSGFGGAAEALIPLAEKHGVELVTRIGDPLDEGDRCFAQTSRILPVPESRQRAKEIALTHGRTLEPKHPLGYGSSEACVVFEDSCPNNSLPILWKSAKNWTALFPRH